MIITVYTDWRKPENRLEAFKRVTHIRSLEGDLDHHHTAKVIADMHGWDNNQKALYAMYFGQSYRNHWAMIAMQLNLIDMSKEDLIDWHNNNWQKMKYGNDTKWNVRSFPEFVLDLQKIGKENIYEHLATSAHVGSTEQNFYSLNKTLQEFYSIGRMTAWLAQQTLYEFFDWDIDHWDQQLYDSGTWSQYDSLCYLFDRLDIAKNQKETDFFGNTVKIHKYSPNKNDIKFMEDKTIELMEYLNEELPFHVDIYNVESVECEYRKTAYGPRKIKEFTFWTSNEIVEQFDELLHLWGDSIDWIPYVAGYMTKGKNLRNYGYSKDYFKVLSEYGLNLNTHYLYKDEPNAHEVLELEKQVPDGAKLMTKYWEKIDSDLRKFLISKYNPVNYLKLKSSNHEGWKNQYVKYGEYYK